MCGLCNSLSSKYGFTFRGLVNHDATFLSLLYSAQSQESVEIQNCPIKLQKPTKNTNHGLEYSGAVSLLMAKAKLCDNIIDNHCFSSRILSRIIDAKIPLAKSILKNSGLDIKYIESEIDRQQTLENQESELNILTGPTENVTAEIFGHLSELTDQKGNFQPLSIMGRNIGKLMYCIDSYMDFTTDCARGKFNVISKGNTAQIYRMIKEISTKAVYEISNSLSNLRVTKHSGIVKDALLSSLEKQLSALSPHSKTPLNWALPNLLLRDTTRGSLPIWSSVTRNCVVCPPYSPW
jgi:hypothetical protein